MPYLQPLIRSTNCQPDCMPTHKKKRTQKDQQMLLWVCGYLLKEQHLLLLQLFRGIHHARCSSVLYLYLSIFPLSIGSIPTAGPSPPPPPPSSIYVYNFNAPGQKSLILCVSIQLTLMANNCSGGGLHVWVGGLLLDLISCWTVVEGEIKNSINIPIPLLS